MAKTSDIQVLIVDDEKDIREAVSGLFRAFGFSVETAHSGSRAWDLCVSRPFHIVITDIRMAGGGGIELLQKIRARNLTSPRVFLITGYTDYSMEHIFQLGADGIFNKPFDSKLLMNTVRQALLSNKDRWAAESALEPENELIADLPSLQEAEADRQFILGRGGFFISIEWEKCTFSEGKPIWFELNFTDEKLESMIGTGIVRWCRPLDDNGRCGMGVEIVFLEEDCRDTTCDLIDDIVNRGIDARSLPTIPGLF